MYVDSSPRERLEARHTGLNFIGSGREVENFKVPLGIGMRRELDVGIDVRHADRGAGHHRAGMLEDASRDCAARILSQHGQRGEEYAKKFSYLWPLPLIRNSRPAPTGWGEAFWRNYIN